MSSSNSLSVPKKFFDPTLDPNPYQDLLRLKTMLSTDNVVVTGSIEPYKSEIILAVDDSNEWEDNWAVPLVTFTPHKNYGSFNYVGLNSLIYRLAFEVISKRDPKDFRLRFIPKASFDVDEIFEMFTYSKMIMEQELGASIAPTEHAHMLCLFAKLLASQNNGSFQPFKSYDEVIVECHAFLSMGFGYRKTGVLVASEISPENFTGNDDFPWEWLQSLYDFNPKIEKFFGINM